MLSAKEQQALKKALNLLENPINETHSEKIAHYLFELQKWNKVYNLTGFKTFEDNLVKNVLDCLSVAPFIKSSRILDVGTGAGLPGMLLAIVSPQQNWVLLDGNGKKTRFLQQLKHSLELSNVEVVNERVENYQTNQKFEGISSRAFDKIPDTLNLCRHLFNTQARFYALKGKLLAEDTDTLPAWATLEENIKISVPMLNEDRHLITVSCEVLESEITATNTPK